jgi:hypothetical protein
MTTTLKGRKKQKEIKNGGPREREDCNMRPLHHLHPHPLHLVRVVISLPQLGVGYDLRGPVRIEDTEKRRGGG